MDITAEVQPDLDAERFQRVQAGFNEFFDWHVRGYVEYQSLAA